MTETRDFFLLDQYFKHVFLCLWNFYWLRRCSFRYYTNNSIALEFRIQELMIFKKLSVELWNKFLNYCDIQLWKSNVDTINFFILQQDVKETFNIIFIIKTDFDIWKKKKKFSHSFFWIWKLLRKSDEVRSKEILQRLIFLL